MPYPLNKKREREGGYVRLFYPLYTCDVFYLFDFWALYNVNGESPIGLQISYMGRT